jgi:hypothetical protein
MTSKKQDMLQLPKSPLAEEAERASNLAARLAAAEDAARKDRARIKEHEMAAAFFASTPPHDVGKF